MMPTPSDNSASAPRCNCAWNDGHAPAHIVGHHGKCPAWVPRPGALGSAKPRPVKRLRSWALPEIPADVMAFRDALGYVWRRQPDRWVRRSGAWTPDPIAMIVRFPHLSPLTEEDPATLDERVVQP